MEPQFLIEVDDREYIGIRDDVREELQAVLYSLVEEDAFLCPETNIQIQLRVENSFRTLKVRWVSSSIKSKTTRRELDT